MVPGVAQVALRMWNKARFVTCIELFHVCQHFRQLGLCFTVVNGADVLKIEHYKRLGCLRRNDTSSCRLASARWPIKELQTQCGNGLIQWSVQLRDMWHIQQALGFRSKNTMT